MEKEWTWTDKLKSEDKEYTVVLKKKKFNVLECIILFFSWTCHELKVVRVIGGKLYRSDLKDSSYREVVEISSYRE